MQAAGLYAAPSCSVGRLIRPRGVQQLVPQQRRVPGRQRRVLARAAAEPSPPPSNSSSSSSSSSSGRPSSSGSSLTSTALVGPGTFGPLEQLLARSFSGGPGRTDWQELEGNWVLRPPAGVATEAVVHFLGGAFVGAAPQLTYRRLLECLASHGALVITTPFATSFDQLRVADEVQYKFDRASRALQVEIGALPVYGVGHSMGSLLHMLINARYAVHRDGNVLMSYNNKPATDSIPFLSPFFGPSARVLGPLLEQLATSPLRAGLESMTDALRGLSPSLVRQLLPVFDQLTPILVDVAQGRQEFSPAPSETQTLLRNNYAVQRNLVIRFKDDSIDGSIELAQLLQSSSAIQTTLDLSLRTLDGDHVRPLGQGLVDLPPELANVANAAAATGSSMLGRLAQVAGQMGVAQAQQPLESLSKGVSSLTSMFAGGGQQDDDDLVQSLADEVAAWLGIGDVVVKGRRALPAAAVLLKQPGSS